MKTFTALLAGILLSGCVKDNWNASLEERELSYEVTERLRIDLDDGEVIWECEIMTGRWFCQTH
tara:strand:+ start:183 stop:374 length:192 start_codon:yes stop_codon:yes gene_type:complete